MPEVIYYYRSSHPAATEYQTECDRREAAYTAVAEAFEAEFSGALAVHEFWSGKSVVGIIRKDCPGTGWRQQDGSDLWVPNMRTRAGRALHARLHEMRLRLPEPPGMPWVIKPHLRRHNPGLEWVGSCLWASWNCDPAWVEADPAFDAGIWQRAKASEYWVAREAAEVAP